MAGHSPHLTTPIPGASDRTWVNITFVAGAECLAPLRNMFLDLHVRIAKVHFDNITRFGVLDIYLEFFDITWHWLV